MFFLQELYSLLTNAYFFPNINAILSLFFPSYASTHVLPYYCQLSRSRKFDRCRQCQIDPAPRITKFCGNLKEKMQILSALSHMQIQYPVFPLTLRLVDECANYLKTIVPKALKRRLCTQILCQSSIKVYQMSHFHKFVEFSKALFTILPKNICPCSNKLPIRWKKSA